jgi:hypothetical protein
MTTVRVEKRKWDGTIAAVDTAYPLAVPGDSAAWFVLAGSRRERPRKGTIEILDSDELWVAVPGEWWVLCGHTDAARSLNGYQVHAAAPFEAPRGGDEIVWVDLDLDFDVIGDAVALEDETQFHDHAREMDYPGEVVRGGGRASPRSPRGTPTVPGRSTGQCRTGWTARKLPLGRARDD